jgi:hypothetical protein
MDGLSETEGEMDGLADEEGETETDGDTEGDNDDDGETDGLNEDDGETDTDGDMDGLSETEGEMDGLSETDGEIDGLIDGDADTDGETEGDADTDGESDGLAEIDGLIEGLAEAEGETETEGEIETEGETDGEMDGESEAEPTLLSYKATNTDAVSPTTAMVGLEVSPVEVLMRNSPLAKTAAALLRDRIAVMIEKFVDGVKAVVLFASLPPPMKYNRDKLERPEIVLNPKPFPPSVLYAFGDVASTRFAPPATVNFHMVAQRSAVELWFIVKTVPIALVPEETKRHIEVVTPSPATPPTVFVCS